MTEPTIEQVANEARNLVPDATDEQATAIERWAMTLCGQSQEKGKEEVRSCVSVIAVTPVTAGSFCYAPDGCLLGRATNTAERGEQVGIEVVPESGQNAYNPYGWWPMDDAPRDGSFIVADFGANVGIFKMRWAEESWLVDSEVPIVTEPSMWRRAREGE